MSETILLGLALVAGVVVAVVAARIFIVRRHTPEFLATLLAPHLRIRRPQGEGPFPTVICFHGCSGVTLGELDWLDVLAEQGYAAVLVDSATPRGLRRWQVCRGLRFWGQERAGDVLAALHHLRTLPFVDPEHLALLGWSHGAWALMDLLALDPPRRLPWNLSHAPENPLAGVRALVLIYPFCGLPSIAGRRGWRHDLPALVLLADNDPLVPGARRAVRKLEALARPVESHVYPGADHAFDMREEDLVGTGARQDPEALVDARRRVAEFLARNVSCQASRFSAT